MKSWSTSYRGGEVMKEIEMTEEEWYAEYKPMVNRIDDTGGAAFDDGEGGTMFETYGNELAYVLSCTARDQVWTLHDGDNGGYFITSGYHLCNRVGYFITEKPVEKGVEVQITLEAPNGE